jgi:hypothetical protein
MTLDGACPEGKTTSLIEAAIRVTGWRERQVGIDFEPEHP